jgi:hypothetical protein
MRKYSDDIKRAEWCLSWMYWGNIRSGATQSKAEKSLRAELQRKYNEWSHNELPAAANTHANAATV